MHCKEVQDAPGFPPEVPTLIHEVSQGQIGVVNLSFHTGCQMVYTPVAAGQVLLGNSEGWRLLGNTLTSDRLPHLSTLRISMSVFLLPQEPDVEITREICDGFELRLSQELLGRFSSHGRNLNLSISVQTLREIFPIGMEGWHDE